jgi:hypothetical protein
MATTLQLEYPYNSGVGTNEIIFQPGTEVGLLIKGGGINGAFTITMYDSDDPGTILSSQIGHCDLLGNANIPVTLPNQRISNLIIAVDFAAELGNPSFTLTLDISTGLISSVYFSINGQEHVSPAFPSGVTLNPILYINNEDAVAHTFSLVAFEDYTLTEIGSFEQSIPGFGSAGFNLNSFVMPNQNDGIEYVIAVDGTIERDEDLQITLISQTGPLTSVAIATMPTSAKANTTVNFSTVVKNISSTTLTVQMKGVLNPGTEDITVAVSPASFSLAPGATKTVSGSFTMLDETCFLDIQSYVNNAMDTFSESIIALATSVPTLVITNTQIAVNGTLAFTGSGFYPNTAISIDVVDSNGNATNVAMPASDASGNIDSTTTPALNFPAGNYELQATDVYGDVATKPFSIIAPATVSITITPSGSGTVTYSPTANLKSGMGITLTPTAKSGYYFSYWEMPDGTTQTTVPGTWILQGGANNITAVFSQTNIPPGQQASISTPVSPAGAGTVVISENAPYSSGEVVTLTAVPAEGYYFAYWLADSTNTINPFQVTLVAGVNIISATFTTTPPQPPGKGLSTGAKIAIVGGSILVVGTALVAVVGRKPKPK